MPETFEQLVARVNRNSFIPTIGVPVMAKQVKLAKGKEFTFAQAKGGGESKYPWDAWLNGDLLLLEQSLGAKDEKGTVTPGPNKGDKRDYEVDTDAMPGKLKSAARRRYKIVQISRKDADGNRLVDSLIIRARDMTAEERAAEDLTRAKEKKANAARRAAKANGQPAGSTAPATTGATA